MVNNSDLTRCGWSTSDELYIRYHDEEWGVPVHEDSKLFEFILLEGAQAGLSWITILKRREAYRKAYDDFNPEIIASWDSVKINELLGEEGIIRNRLKIESAVKNARAFLKVQEEFGSFDKYIWNFVDGKTIQNSFRSLSEIPAETELSRVISKDLKRRGFSFVGPTIVYATMQAVGMVNDHLTSCFRYKELHPPY